MEVFYGGEILGESAIEFFEDIGPTVKHSYEVETTHTIITTQAKALLRTALFSPAGVGSASG